MPWRLQWCVQHDALDVEEPIISSDCEIAHTRDTLLGPWLSILDSIPPDHTQDNRGCQEIDVYFLYGGDNDLEHIVIRDNGKGMTKEELEAYGRFGYSQSRRKADGLVRDVKIPCKQTQFASATACSLHFS